VSAPARRRSNAPRGELSWADAAVRPAGTFFPEGGFVSGCHGGKRQLRERAMNGLIYLIGLIVVILFILSLLGLR
jgi:hypothetical protein